MAGYGYAQPKFGTALAPKVKPLTPGQGLASAASGTPTAVDPFGLGVGHENSPAPGPYTPGPPMRGIPQTQSPTSTPPPTNGGQAPQPVAPQQNIYDLNTDPALQQVNAFTGLSDQQANAAAEKQRRDQLLAYGDEQLVQSLLGDSTLAKAAANNPTSTLKTLGHQKDQGLHDLLASLIAPGHNLGFSGYRVKQEQNIGEGYQNALAQAASGLNSNLDSITGNLNGALGQNANARASAQGDAYARMLQELLLNPPIAAAAAGDGAGGNYTLAAPTKLSLADLFLHSQPPPPSSPRIPPGAPRLS